MCKQPRSQGVLTSYADQRSRMNTLVHFDEMRQNLGAFGSHYGFHSWLGNAKLRKMTVALALILQKMNGEIENKHFEDLI